MFHVDVSELELRLMFNHRKHLLVLFQSLKQTYKISISGKLYGCMGATQQMVTRDCMRYQRQYRLQLKTL